jgi:hypothetical protein
MQQFTDGAVPSITYESTPENHGVLGSNPGLATYEVPAKRRKIENFRTIVEVSTLV